MTTTVDQEVLSAGRREDIERALDSLGLKWRFVAEGSITDIDMAKSLANQARLGEPINRERIETYKEALKQRADFPAVVVDFTGRKRKGIVMDGNHRLVSADEGGYDLFARYEVTDGDPAAITLYTFQANTKHGLPNAMEDRIEHAIWLIESGVSQTQALRQLQIPATQFKRAWSTHMANRRADEVGLDRREWDSLQHSVRQRLLNVNTDDAFAGAARLAFRAQLGADDVFELTTQLNGTKSWAKQEQILASMEAVFADQIKAAAGGNLTQKSSRKAMTPKQRWNMALGNIVALPDEKSVVRMISASERPEMKKRLNAAADRLKALASQL